MPDAAGEYRNIRFGALNRIFNLVPGRQDELRTISEINNRDQVLAQTQPRDAVREHAR